MSNEILAILLDETKAHWVDSASMGLLPDKTLVREWRNIPVEHREACMASLRAKRSYNDPKTQTKTHTGKYRIQKVEDIVSKDKEGRIQFCIIRETLAFGLAQTLTDAGQTSRIVNDTGIPGAAVNQGATTAHTGNNAIQQPLRKVILTWVNIDPNYANAIQTSRTNVTETSLTVNGETLTGPWYIQSRGVKQVDDGSATYEETWSLGWTIFESRDAVGNIGLTANRFIQGVPKNKVKDVLDSELALSGNYGAAGFRYMQKVYWREDSADIATESSIRNEVSDSNTAMTSLSASTVRTIYENTSAIPDADTAVQGKTVSVVGAFKDDGKFDYTKEIKTAVKQEVEQFDSEVSFAKTEKTKSGENLYDADIAAYGISQTAGKVYRRSHVKQPDGTFQDVVTEISSISQTASTDGTHSDQHLDADDRTEDTVRATAASTPAADVAFATQGTIVETENAPNEDGTFRTEVKTVVSKEQEILDAVMTEDKFKTVKVDIGKQIKDANLLAHYPIVATVGEIHSRRLSENSDGTFDVERSRDIAKTVTNAETSSEISLFETLATSIDRNNTVGGTPPVSQTAGKIVKVTNKTNDYDMVDVIVETRTAVQVSDADKSKTISLFETRTEASDKHQASATPEETTQTNGKIVTTRSQKDEFGRYTNTTETRDSTNIAEAVKETKATAFETVSSVTDRNDVSAETPITSQTAGTIKTATARKNEFGEYDNTLETRTAVAASTTYSSQSSALTTEETVSNRNADAKEDASGGGSGTIVQVTSRINEFGKYDNEKQTKTAVPATDTQDTESSAWQTSSTVRKRNAESLEAGSGGGNGAIVRASGSKNEFGKYDTEKETVTGVDASVSAYNHVKTQDYTATLAVYKNAINPPSLGTSYGEVRYEKNAFGLYDGTKIVRTYNVDTSLYLPYTGLTSVHIESETSPSDKTKDRHRKITSTYNISYQQTQGAAYNAISGGLDGSGVQGVAKNIWMAKKVTGIVAAAWSDSSDGAWSY